MRAKRPVRGGIKVRAYPVLCRAVEEGVAYGWRRAHKHIDTPDAETERPNGPNRYIGPA